MDHYSTLAIDKGASFDEVKRAYRQLVLLHHPDKTKNDDTMFKAITVAYSVLSDADKRREYDAIGQVYDISDLFEEVARKFTDFVFEHKEPLSEIIVEIPLSRVNSGGSEEVTYQIEEKCTHCDGIGAKNSQDVTTCLACNGTGRDFSTDTVTDSRCISCDGKRHHIKLNKVCIKCKGTTTCKASKTIEVLIPKGVPDGHSKRLAEKGGYNSRKGKNDDVWVVFQYAYSKKGISVHASNDVSITIDVRLEEILTGFVKRIHLYDKPYKLCSMSYLDPSRIRVISGMGLPIYKQNTCGSLYISFNVIYPDKQKFSRYHVIFQQMFKRDKIIPPDDGNMIDLLLQPFHEFEAVNPHVSKVPM